MSTGADNIYWLFSASAQAVAAFFAFLLTGFALVLTIMDGVEQRDDSLAELHGKLKARYYKQIKFLATVTTVSILSSLLMTFVNAYDFSLKTVAVSLTALVNAVSIIWGVVFIVGIIDPNKYAKIAAEEFRRDKLKSDQTAQNENANAFFTSFIGLERKVREYITAADLDIPSQGQNRLPYSFRQMIEVLFRNEIIDSATKAQLLDVNRIRNVVFHGHESVIDKKYVQVIAGISATLDRAFASARNRK